PLSLSPSPSPPLPLPLPPQTSTMPIEYDLVIIGASEIGIRIATIAQQWGARVALVEQGEQPSQWLWQQTLFATVQTSELFQWCYPNPQKLDWQRAVQWADGIAADDRQIHSLASLALQGIDAIAGWGKFTTVLPSQANPSQTISSQTISSQASPVKSNRKAHIGFQVGERLLRSRAYCIALTEQPTDPPSFPEKSALTLATALRQAPPNLSILGHGATAIALASCLNRVGSQVTLITAADHLLPNCDREFAHQVEHCLSHQGIKLLTQTQVQTISASSETFKLQLKHPLGDHLHFTAELVDLTQSLTPLDTLNLEAIGLRTAAVKGDRFLQTQHPRVWLCPTTIADPQRLATTLVDNMLFWPKRPVDLQGQPQQLTLQPNCAWVGLSETAALAQFGNQVMTCSLIDRDRNTQMLDGSVGFYKLITRRNGQILGFSALGNNASAIVSLFAVAMQQKIPLQKLQTSAIVPLSGLETLASIINHWQAQRLEQQYWQREWRLDWLVWHRR
ncbi:MAG: FAD-dependent oxidoreductase, partial [Synechococcales bacterium]|nr:FAD-dependent oxidoreductase [Synechococcales bacterium]